MNGTLLPLLLLAGPASAQLSLRGSVLIAPASVTPVVAPRLTAPNLISLAPLPALSVLPSAPPSVIPTAAPQAIAKAAPAAVQPLAAAAKALEAVHGAAPAVAPILNRLFEASAQAPNDAVAAGSYSQGVRPALSRPALNAARPSAEPAPPTPGWKRAALAVGRGAGFLVSTWMGMTAADVVYSLAAAKIGLAGVLLIPAALAAGAWFLRRGERSLGSRLFWGGVLVSASFSAVGQLAWDLTGSPVIGLPVGIAVGIFLALASAGVFPRKSRPSPLLD